MAGKKKLLPVRDMRCGPHGVVGCLDCWARIIRGKDQRERFP